MGRQPHILDGVLLSLVRVVSVNITHHITSCGLFPMLPPPILYLARIQDFWKGGGVQARIQDFSQAPPLDIVRVTSSALRKFEKHPHAWTFTSTPLGHCPRDVIHIPRGGGRGDHPCHTHTLDPPLGSILGLQAKKGGGPTLGPMLKSLHRGPKGGGGVRTPWTPPPPPGSATVYIEHKAAIYNLTTLCLNGTLHVLISWMLSWGIYSVSHTLVTCPPSHQLSKQKSSQANRVDPLLARSRSQWALKKRCYMYNVVGFMSQSRVSRLTSVCAARGKADEGSLKSGSQLRIERNSVHDANLSPNYVQTLFLLTAT